MHRRRDWHPWKRRLLAVLAFGVAFGYLEAAVVAYLRHVYDPVRAAAHPGAAPDALLPLLTLAELRAADPRLVDLLGIELGRELATIVMLATLAAAATRRRGEWIAHFIVAFGTWDLAYYAGLRAMVGFPESLLDWDILFLIPVPWLGPVLAPVLVSVTLIAAGTIVLREIARERPLRASPLHWAAVIAGGLIVIYSFCAEHARTALGEMPQAYSWITFAVGELIALAAFAHALWHRAPRRDRDGPAQ